MSRDKPPTEECVRLVARDLAKLPLRMIIVNNTGERITQEQRESIVRSAVAKRDAILAGKPDPNVALYDAACEAVDVLTRCLALARDDHYLSNDIQRTLSALCVSIDTVNGRTGG
jgi:hypothetical protein